MFRHLLGGGQGQLVAFAFYKALESVALDQVRRRDQRSRSGARRRRFNLTDARHFGAAINRTHRRGLRRLLRG